MPSELYKLPFLSTMASLVLVIASLYWARVVLIPLALAILLTFLLRLIVEALRRTGLGRAPAAVLVVLWLALVLGVVGWIVLAQFSNLASELPRYTDNLKQQVAFRMVQHGLDPRRFEVDLTRATLLTAEVLALVEQTAPTLVCIGLVPPGGFAQARYLCKRLRTRFPTLPIVIGCWSGMQEEVAPPAQLHLDSLTQVGTTLLETRQQIRQLPQVHTPSVAPAMPSVAQDVPSMASVVPSVA